VLSPSAFCVKVLPQTPERFAALLAEGMGVSFAANGRNSFDADVYDRPLLAMRPRFAVWLRPARRRPDSRAGPRKRAAAPDARRAVSE